MANRNNVHIVQRGDGWGTLREGGQRASEVFDTQAQAIQAGRDMARQGQGELLIHGQDGRIRARDSYGNDPCPPKDSEMIKIDFKGPKPADLLRAASAEIEKQIAAKARAATGRHGGMTVRFSRKADGTVRSVEFQGSPAAIEAAKLAMERSR